MDRNVRPRERRRRWSELAESLREILTEPAVRQRLAEIGFEAQRLPPTKFAEHVANDIEL